MMRPILTLATAAMLVGTPALAQDAPTQVYTAYYKIGYDDLADWNAAYHAYWVPVLEELVDEGVIEGYGAWQHNTGGEYNWRFVARASDWANFDTFWSEYLSRSAAAARAGGEDPARYGAMIQAHSDEIWDITSVNVPEGASAQYMYDSRFQLSFADLAVWNGVWAETVAPVLNQAMADGLLVGWVQEGHNTGGRYNWKVLYLFDEWDDMDDMFARVLPAMMGDPEVWSQVGGMIRAHDDVIWEAVPGPEGM